MRIGIDFDNTIICYDKVFAAAASQRGLVSGEWKGSKTDLRDDLRSRPGGELAWQGLQGWVYGKGIGEAEIFPGVAEFLAACREAEANIYIVSHKTKFGHQDPDRTDLRAAARGWLHAAGVIGSTHSALKADDVHFEDTMAAKGRSACSAQAGHLHRRSRGSVRATPLSQGNAPHSVQWRQSAPTISNYKPLATWTDIRREVFAT